MGKDKGLVQFLLKEGLITDRQFEEARLEGKLTDAPVQKILISKGFITAEGLARAMARQIDIPYIKLSDEKINSQIVQMIPVDLARQYKALPVKMEGNDLYVAFASPLNLPAIDEIKLLTGCVIKPLVATEKEIDEAINRHFRAEEVTKQALIDMRLEKIKEVKVEKEKAAAIEEEIGRVEDIPVVRLVNDIINGAIDAQASDIHLEPQEPEMIVRYRVDGILHDIMTIPAHVESQVVSRVKVLSDMDISERRRPQDGHITIKKDAKGYDLRVSIMLTVNGEKVVMRILEKSSMLLSLEKLGLTEHDEEIFRLLVSKPYGMILVTGPTGSGKTTTLYTVLSQLDSKSANIITIEEPVEYKLNRITQVQVAPGAKMTFATGLRTILRQDPDIIMVGEIRDRETAETAVQAALTGHLVFSTLHTNDAPSAVTRLIDMGVEPFLIASTVIGAIAQRLCRTICPECKEEYAPDDNELAFLRDTGYKLSGPDNASPAVIRGSQDIKLARGNGCDFCYQTGLKGRAGIFEVMKVSDGLRRLIVERRPAAEIKKSAVEEGMKTLQENGLQKILARVSTIEEIRRVVYVEGI